MDTDLTPDQRAIADGARSFLAAECPPARVRAAWAEGAVLDRRLWTALAGVGFLGVAVPEAFGGMGCGDLEVAVLLEEAGRVALPAPLAETMVAALTLTERGSPAQRERWLPGIAAGQVVATIAAPDHAVAAHAADADLLLVPAGDGVHALERGRCRVVAQPAFDAARRLGAVEIVPGADASGTAADTLLPGGPATRRLADRIAVATAATLLGISAHLVDTTVGYVGQRHQFGRPVGSFQAVKHRIADAHVAVEMARPAVRVAAHLLSLDDPQAPVASAVAAVAAGDAGRAANEHALQCHGGIGFTWEHDLHLWLKRGKALEFACGAPATHRARLAATLFDHPADRPPPERTGS
ncbi:acyl-CoA dehydrogenase family protein [Pseudonocardia sp. WMMC193]|uniref:acyl-CoA dehydrogenase family protein n=1 Tax=Pseudonocardia sp. WMMC193 TaxID=2911965 RepID=UPI001F33FDF5|nr:acyl-CoA dehydrogenase family protein [Pseudonocardia sp. WMMC193]MCF7550822.1 acyl-CoA/acyl-ACP dehydrogenase [Pseudonocardia sp. WMMC193]